MGSTVSNKSSRVVAPSKNWPSGPKTTRAMPLRPSAENEAQPVGYSTGSPVAVRKVTRRTGSSPRRCRREDGAIEKIAPVSTSASTVSVNWLRGFPISSGTRKTPMAERLGPTGMLEVVLVGPVGDGGVFLVLGYLGWVPELGEFQRPWTMAVGFVHLNKHSL